MKRYFNLTKKLVDHQIYYMIIVMMSLQLLTAIAEASSIYYNYAGQAKCLNVSQTAVSSLGNDAWNFQVISL